MWKLQSRVNIFQGCSTQLVPYHLAILTERWQDIYEKVHETSVDLTAVTSYAMWDPVLGGSVLVPKLGLRFPESSTVFSLHCVLEGRHVTAAVLPVKDNVWKVTHGRRSSGLSGSASVLL